MNNRQDLILERLKNTIISCLIENKEKVQKNPLPDVKASDLDAVKRHHVPDVDRTTLYGLNTEVLLPTTKLAFEKLPPSQRYTLLQKFNMNYIKNCNQHRQDFFMWDNTTVAVPELQCDDNAKQRDDLKTIDHIIEQETQNGNAIIHLVIPLDHLASRNDKGVIEELIEAIHKKYPRLTAKHTSDSIVIIGVNSQASPQQIYDNLLQKIADIIVGTESWLNVADYTGRRYLRDLTENEKEQFLACCATLTLARNDLERIIANNDGLDCQIYIDNETNQWVSAQLLWDIGYKDNITKRTLREKQESNLQELYAIVLEKAQRDINKDITDDPTHHTYNVSVTVELPQHIAYMTEPLLPELKNNFGKLLKRDKIVVDQVTIQNDTLMVDMIYLPLMDIDN